MKLIGSLTALTARVRNTVNKHPLCHCGVYSEGAGRRSRIRCKSPVLRVESERIVAIRYVLERHWGETNTFLPRRQTIRIISWQSVWESCRVVVNYAPRLLYVPVVAHLERVGDRRLVQYSTVRRTISDLTVRWDRVYLGLKHLCCRSLIYIARCIGGPHVKTVREPAQIVVSFRRSARFKGGLVDFLAQLIHGLQLALKSAAWLI